VLGGPVAIAYAARYPERVSHLVLYGTYTRGRFRVGRPEISERARLMLELTRLGRCGSSAHRHSGTGDASIILRQL
jgi:pimeloyl-ACP methyl ester carboxylesterase